MSCDHKNYQVYLVGGAVRDELLGLTVIDHDWVVTGATPAQLLAENYQQVGSKFPVFLHPSSKDEYALARTEKKQGNGYTGFVCDFSPTITLEEDLVRRDLTINAIAKTKNGEIIDPFNGQSDIKNKILRHVSNAFIEDPLRVLRVARFSARFAQFGFTVAFDTKQLMLEMSHSGELLNLSKERVWKELEKALGYKNPESFFNVLMICNALEKVLPGFEWPQIEALLENNNIAQESIIQLDNTALIWAFLCHKTHPEKLHTLHSILNSPNQYKLYANLVSDFTHNAQLPLPPQEWIEWLQKFNALKKPQLYTELVQVLSLITQTTTDHWFELRSVIASVSSKALIQKGLKGIELGNAIKSERLTKLTHLKSTLIKVD